MREAHMGKFEGIPSPESVTRRRIRSTKWQTPALLLRPAPAPAPVARPVREVREERRAA